MNLDYLLLPLIFALGVGFHVMQKIQLLRIKFPTLGPRQVLSTFFHAEWDSLIVSSFVLAILVVAFFISNHNEIKLPPWLDNWGMYIFSLLLGYAGQSLAYRWLGTAQGILEKKADDLARSNGIEPPKQQL